MYKAAAENAQAGQGAEGQAPGADGQAGAKPGQQPKGAKGKDDSAVDADFEVVE